MFKYLKMLFCSFALVAFCATANASVCEEIYKQVQEKGCGILKKVPQANKICTIANGGSKKLCEWCSKHQAICIAAAHVILPLTEKPSFKDTVIQIN